MTTRVAAGAAVVAVARSAIHDVRKQTVASIRLLAGLGVEGDAHLGVTVQHRSRVAQDPTQPNLRQVHLLASELFDELLARGFNIEAGQIGENISTCGIDLLTLSQRTRLHIGDAAVLEITGLRNPCTQLNGIAPGLMSAVLDRMADGTLVRKAGVMAIVLRSGEVRPGDRIEVELPMRPWQPLERV